MAAPGMIAIAMTISRVSVAGEAVDAQRGLASVAGGSVLDEVPEGLTLLSLAFVIFEKGKTDGAFTFPRVAFNDHVSTQFFVLANDPNHPERPLGDDFQAPIAEWAIDNGQEFLNVGFVALLDVVALSVQDNRADHELAPEFHLHGVPDLSPSVVIVGEDFGFDLGRIENFGGSIPSLVFPERTGTKTYVFDTAGAADEARVVRQCIDWYEKVPATLGL